MTWTRRTARSLLTLLAVLVLGLGLFGLTARPAAAAEPGEVLSYAIDYNVTTSGVVQVKETIDYRFGPDETHGLDRFIVTRESDEASNPGYDAVYGLSNIEVSSPDGVPTQWERTDEESQQGREVSSRIRIGDPDREVSVPEATYVISYDLTGAIRSPKGVDQFYWDTNGTGWAARIDRLDVTVAVPGGSQGVDCNVGESGSRQDCQKSSTVGNKGEFAQNDLAGGENMTVAVMITPGLVSADTPDLEPDGSKLTGAEKAAAITGAGVGGAVVVGSPLVGWAWWRRKGRDKRYVGLPPGTVPYAGQTAEVGYHDKDIQIPVAFSPPRIPVAEAGLLVDGQVDTRETAATLIDLAVRGAITVQGESKDDYQVTLVDPSRATAPHEVVLLHQLFNRQPAGAVADLGKQGSITGAHNAMATKVREQVQQRGWFTEVPSAKGKAGFGFGAVIVLGVVLFQIAREFWWLVLFAAPIAITIAVVRSKLRRGQRTPDGRAVTDQVEGFKLYLSTAEAEQLRFEEGEDIFSKYLPWAIAFDLADRWAKICGDLVAAGRLPNATPYWYSGTGNWTAFNVGYLMSGMTTAATPVPSSGSGGSGGTGFGSGGSSFGGGGGFSGGGGGGGGGGGW